MLSWQGVAINKLHDLVLVQAYMVCLRQEEARKVASEHIKFNSIATDIRTKKTQRVMEFPPPNPHFLEVKEALKSEIDKRNIKL